jgi:hypothetical protein
MNKTVSAILFGLCIGFAAYFVKDARLEKQTKNKEQFAKDIIAEINRITVNKDEIKEATLKAAEISQMIDEYANGVRKNNEYAKTLAQMAVKRVRKNSIEVKGILT